MLLNYVQGDICMVNHSYRVAVKAELQHTLCDNNYHTRGNFHGVKISLYSKQTGFSQSYFYGSPILSFCGFLLLATWLQKTTHNFDLERLSALPSIVLHQVSGMRD